MVYIISVFETKGKRVPDTVIHRYRTVMLRYEQHLKTDKILFLSLSKDYNFAQQKGYLTPLSLSAPLSTLNYGFRIFDFSLDTRYYWVMKKKILHKIYQYTAVFEPDEKVGGFTVTVPSLPGCISEGDTFEEALKNIQEAASLYIEVMQKRKTEILQEEKGVVIAPIEVAV